MQFLRGLMAGRRGSDRLGIVLVCAAAAMMFLRRVTDWRMFYLLSLVFLTVFFLRFFSRDINRRYQEEQWFIGQWGRLKSRFTTRRDHPTDNKTYKYYNCPSCGQKLRVPRGRGKIRISCPGCHTEFDKRT